MSAAYANSLSESCSRWMYKPINWEFSGACRDSGLWRKKGQDGRQDRMKLLRVIPHSFSKKNQSIKLKANKTHKYTDVIHTMLLSACANDAYYVHCMHFTHIQYALYLASSKWNDAFGTLNSLSTLWNTVTPGASCIRMYRGERDANNATLAIMLRSKAECADLKHVSPFNAEGS